jgi:hypothetical protein
MHVWMTLQLLHHPSCQMWVTVHAAYGNTSTHSSSLLFTYGGWRGSFFLSIDSIQIKHLYRFKDRLLIRHRRVKQNKDIIGDRVCLYTIYALYLPQVRFYTPFSLT